MFLFFFYVILVKNLDQPILKEEKIFQAEGFGDYQIDISNETQLNINVPGDYFIFISSPDGFKASIYNSATQDISNKIGEINPNSENKLIYFDQSGNNISTINI